MKTETIMTLNDSNIKTVLVAFCTLISLTGCSDLSISDGNMENIFSSRRDDVLMPDQRIVCDKNKYTLCLKVEADKDIVCMDDPEPVYLAAVYPKLETGRIGVFCWNNY